MAFGHGPPPGFAAGAPPPNQYGPPSGPPPGHPQAGGYQQGGYQQGQPDGQRGPGGYQQGGYQQGGYQQGGYQQGPQGGYQQNQPNGYQQSAPGGYHQGAPGGYQQGPPGGYQQGPQGGYPQGAPGGGYQQGPPPNQPYGAPPQPYQQQAPGGYHNAGPGPAQPVHGAPVYPASQPSQPYYDPGPDLHAIVRATRGMGTDEKALVQILAHKTPAQIAALSTAYRNEHKGKTLVKLMEKETSGYFLQGLTEIVLGPLGADVQSLHESVIGTGTDELLLNDVLIGRTNSEMNALKGLYRQMFGRSLERDVADDLSLKTKTMFSMITSATRQEEHEPVQPQRVQQDVSDLHRAIGRDELQVCAILTNRSNNSLRAIAQSYEQAYGKKLVVAIEKNFSGHMKKALLMIVRLAINPAACFAALLEDAMAGMGTKDKLLVSRIVRYHWDPALMNAIKQSYRTVYHRELAQRIRTEVSGDYRRLMLALVE
ncbi:Annexin [Dipodascopsis tothii]|uniref:Annexin n=1 Tax=Dipodascopsis tothii TaxID=44089 RepID=UPI0034CD5667